MRKVHSRQNKGAAMLWIVGLLAAFLLVELFCQSGEAPCNPQLQGEMATPMVDCGARGYEQVVKTERQFNQQSSHYAVRNYRQSYRDFTQTMTHSSSSLQEQRAAYGGYTCAYGGYRKYRW